MVERMVLMMVAMLVVSMVLILKLNKYKKILSIIVFLSLPIKYFMLSMNLGL